MAVKDNDLLAGYGFQALGPEEVWAGQVGDAAYVTVVPSAEVGAGAIIAANAALSSAILTGSGSSLTTFYGGGTGAVLAANTALNTAFAASAAGGLTGFYGGVLTQAPPLNVEAADIQTQTVYQGTPYVVYAAQTAPELTSSSATSAGIAIANPPAHGLGGLSALPSLEGWQGWRLGVLLTLSVFFVSTVLVFFAFDAGAVGLFIGFFAFFVSEIVVARREQRPMLLPPGIAFGGAVASIALAAAVVIASS